MPKHTNTRACVHTHISLYTRTPLYTYIFFWIVSLCSTNKLIHDYCCGYFSVPAVLFLLLYDPLLYGLLVITTIQNSTQLLTVPTASWIIHLLALVSPGCGTHAWHNINMLSINTYMRMGHTSHDMRVLMFYIVCIATRTHSTQKHTHTQGRLTWAGEHLTYVQQLSHNPTHLYVTDPLPSPHISFKPLVSCNTHS